MEYESEIEISICTGLMLNDHSNPYIESTTVLSEKYYRTSRSPFTMRMRTREIRLACEIEFAKLGVPKGRCSTMTLRKWFRNFPFTSVSHRKKSKKEWILL